MKKLIAALLVLSVLVGALLVVVSTNAKAATSRMGGWADSVIWSEQPNQAQALLDLQNNGTGGMDIGALPFGESSVFDGRTIGANPNEGNVQQQQ